jgi:membrane protein DedA with SNARE-associated domain
MKKWTVLIAFFAISSLVWAQNTPTSTKESKSNIQKEGPSIIEQVEQWYSENMNYLTITTLMTIESSFIPFPSEIVIPPAVYVAEDPNSSLHATDSNLVNMFLIVLFGTIGAVLGAIINYLLAMWLGRPIIYKFADSKIGHICLLSGEKVKKAEDYFNDHGKVSTFVGRLIPGIRQLVSIPAGLCKMHFGWFIFYTFLGAGIWNTVLALLGYITRGQKELIDTYSHEISGIIMALLGIAILYFVIKKIIKRKKNA